MIREATQTKNVTKSGKIRQFLDFVFPCFNKKKKNNKNPHLTLTRWKGPICLVDAWKVSNMCLEGIMIKSGF